MPAGAPVDGSLCIHHLFERQVPLAAQRVAVRDDSRSITYEALNARANRLARHLQSLGAGRDALIGILMSRCVGLVEALLATLKSGAAYVPLDPTYPQDRLSYMVADSLPKVLLVHQPTLALARELLSAAGASHCTLVNIDEEVDGVAGEPADGVDLQVAEAADPARALAYVIYTSGSTGKPKGAMNEHGPVVNYLQWLAAELDADAGEVLLQKTSFSFDASVWDFFLPLAVGGQVVMAKPEGHKDPAYLADAIARHRVTTVQFVPSMLQIFLDHADLRACQSLRRVICGGEALPRALVQRLRDALPHVRLHNLFGPTETAIAVTGWASTPGVVPDVVPIGRPVWQARIHLLDAQMTPVRQGEIGEMYIGGLPVGRGYLRRPELTAERFLPDPFSDQPGARLYKTGDLARCLPDGQIEYVGRNDQQVKIRGFRVELGEIEAALLSLPDVSHAAVLAVERGGEPRLVAYVAAQAGVNLEVTSIRTRLAQTLADHMVPSVITLLPAMPLGPTGKIDRQALPALQRSRPELATAFQAPVGAVERQICTIFADLLDLDAVGRDDNFFDLGGNSLGVVRVADRLARSLGRRVSVPTVFAHATVRALAAALEGEAPARAAALPPSRQVGAAHAIAVIGMSGRFPGAVDVDAFWANLLAGRDCITNFEVDQLDPSVPPELRRDPAYVLARGVVDGVEDFDPAFFGISVREAEVMDPQHRLLLELAWECLEVAGVAPDRLTDAVGVFAGMSTPTYLMRHVMAHPDVMARLGELQVMLANDKDYGALRIAHKLGLKGPAIGLSTACSTSLVAIVQAVDALRQGRCRMALAGAASITSPSRVGHLYQEGSMLSKDGRTRTFDAAGTGTAFNDGAALVLLKPLDAAIADGDPVYAVIRGAAINNDGGGKASFTAPSVDGQAAVIAAALEDAGVSARQISYVEAHGTATPLGDPVEVEALTRAYRAWTDDIGFCRIGSVKSNVGHLVAAAGAAGLIKTALALHTEHLPASLHFTTPNPALGLAQTPFKVADRPLAWPRTEGRRLAGVSSFGVGGTNAHVILEEAPLRSPSTPAQGAQLLLLSARDDVALSRMATRLADTLERGADSINLADVAHTLQVGRQRFSHRLAIVASSAAEAAHALREAQHPRRVQRRQRPTSPGLVWVFPGQGAQYPGMGRGLHAADPAFRAAFDEVAALVLAAEGPDLRSVMASDDDEALRPTAVTQPATFALEYALAQSWRARGAEPVALIGHSVGEFVAAVLAGVMSLADAARLVTRRGALMQAQAAGGMLSVRLPAAQLLAELADPLCLAAENSPSACVVAGPFEALQALQQRLEAQGVAVRPLQTSHAFHSSMMDPAVPPFAQALEQVALAPPDLPIASTLTGRWLTADQAVDPVYWSTHLREPVRFSPAAMTVLADHPEAVFLEIGPRASLCALLRQHRTAHGQVPMAVASLVDRPELEITQLALAQGELWAFGLEPSSSAASPAHGRQRLALPTYPFERVRCWLPALAAPAASSAHPMAAVAPQRPVITTSTLDAPTMTTTTQASLRQPRLQAELRSLLEEVSGIDLDGVSPDTRFVELGFDSLILTQAAQQVKSHFQVPVRFRQLMEEQCTLAALAAYLDAQLPPEAAPPVALPSIPSMASAAIPPDVPAVPVAAMLAGGAPGGGADQSSVQWLIQQQMQLMSQQLHLLSGVGGAMHAPVMAAAAAMVPAVPSVPVTPAASLATAPPPVAPGAPAAPTSEVASGVQTYDVKKAFGAIARIHTQGSELTERQRLRLDAFIRRYTERTAKSKAYTAQHRPHLADPRVVNGFRPMTKEMTYQVVVERTKGSRVWDLDGNEYVDVLNGFGMNLFGWQPDFIQDAVRAQLDKGYEIGPQHPLAGEVAQLVCELTGFDRAGLCNTGSEAVMAAIRIARTVTQRSMIVSFNGSYHGTFDEVLVRGGKGGRAMSAAPGILPGMFGDIRVLDYGTPEALAFIREHADEIAAVLVEPVQSRRPDFQPKEFLQEVRDITSASGSCLIFDEVITGFRAHVGGVQALFGIRADLATYGKVIGGGFPVGVIAGKREFMDALDGGQWQYGDDSIPTVGVTYFAGTFVRHPLALAAAKAALLHLKAHSPTLQNQLNLHTAALASELSAFCKELGVPVTIRHFASLWRVTWLEDHPLQDLLFAMMRSRGVHILDNFPCFMTTAHTAEDIATIKTAFKESVAELQESEFLPRRVEAAVIADVNQPPAPNARLGRDKDGNPTWFIPDPKTPGKYVKINP